jgi:hypothetical protein
MNSNAMTAPFPVIKKYYLYVTQASFHGVTHHAHAVVIAFLLKTKPA